MHVPRMRIHHAAVLCWALLAWPVGLRAQPSPEAQGAFTVRGLVLESAAATATSANAHPLETLEEIAVRQLDGSPRPTLARASVRADGTFDLRLRPVPESGFFWVTVATLTSRYELLVPVVGSAVDLPELRSHETPPVTIRVHDPQGLPLHDVVLVATPGASPFDSEGAPRWRHAQRRVTTDADGRAQLPAARWQVAGELRGRDEWSRPIVIPGSELTGQLFDRADGQPQSEGSLVLRAVDGLPLGRTSATPGAALPHGAVHLERPADFEDPRPGRGGSVSRMGPLGSVERSNAEGRLPGLPSPLRRQARLLRRHPDGRVEVESLVDPTARRHDASGRATLRLRIQDSTGARVEGAQVLLGPRRRAVTRTDGHVDLLWLWPETKLTVLADGFAAAQVTATEGVGERQTITLHRGALGVGRVLDEGGAPVAGAQVVLHLLEGPQAPDVETISGIDGRFELRRLTPGLAELKVRATGFAPATIRGIELPSATPRFEIGDVLLQQGAILDGRVVDTEGDGVPEVRVYVGVAAGNRRPGARGRAQRFLRTGERLVQHDLGVTSDDEGWFRVGELLPDERIRLEFGHPDYARRRLFVQMPVEDDLVVELERAFALHGTVLDPSGKPATGARVQLEGPRQGGRARSDDDGSFALRPVPAGSYRVSAHLEGYLSSRPLDVELPTSDEAVELRLRRGVRLRGSVYSADGTALAGARVWVGSQSAHSDEGGAYSLDGLEPGPSTVWARSRSGNQLERELQLADAENHHDLYFDDGLVVSGRVSFDDGTPAAGATVHTNAGVGAVAQADDTGNFEILDQPVQGSFRLVARLDSRTASKTIELPSEAAGIELVLERRSDEPGAIAGRVEGLDIDQLAGVDLSLRRSDQSIRVHKRPSYDGTFDFGNVTPGSWHVQAQRAGRRTLLEQVEVRPAETAEVVFDFDSGGHDLRIRATVDGQPAAHLGLRLRKVGGAFRTSTVPDYLGQALFEGLDAGHYVLEPRGRAAFRPRSIELPRDEELTLDLHTVEIRVGAGSAQAWPGAIQASIHDGSGAEMLQRSISARSLPQTWVLEQGRYELRLTRAGRSLRFALPAERERMDLPLPLGELLAEPP